MHQMPPRPASQPQGLSRARRVTLLLIGPLIFSGCSELVEPTEGTPEVEQQPAEILASSDTLVFQGRTDTVTLTALAVDSNGVIVERELDFEFRVEDPELLERVSNNVWRALLPGKSVIEVTIPDYPMLSPKTIEVVVIPQTTVDVTVLFAVDSVLMNVTLHVPDSAFAVDAVWVRLDLPEEVSGSAPGFSPAAAYVFSSRGEAPVGPGETRTIRIPVYTAPDGVQRYVADALSFGETTTGTRTVQVPGDTLEVHVSQSDRTPPVVTFLDPPDGKVLSRADTILEYRFRAVDTGGIFAHHATLSWDSCQKRWTGMSNVMRVTDYHRTDTTSCFGMVDPLQPGENQIVLTVWDVALNATTDTLTIVYDPEAAAAVSTAAHLADTPSEAYEPPGVVLEFDDSGARLIIRQDGSVIVRRPGR